MMENFSSYCCCVIKNLMIGIISLLALILVFLSVITFNLLINPMPTPTTENNILVSAGTGTDPLEVTELTLDIPFGSTLYSKGNSVSHLGNSPEFVILESGEYQINYQLATYNPVLSEGLPIDITVNLVSNRSGILDTISFTTAHQLVQRSISRHLDSEEVLYLQAIQSELTEMAINSQAITIVKLP